MPEPLDVVRSYLHLLGPANPKAVAAYVDAPVKDVKNRWPEDVVAVSVAGETRWVLAGDLPDLRSAPRRSEVVRLLSPFDMFLQARDRDLLVPEVARRKLLWVALGRPGAVVSGGEVVGTWRPRTSGRSLRLLLDLWCPVPEVPLREQVERLAAYRGHSYAGPADE